MSSFEIKISGDSAINLKFSDEISEKTSRLVRSASTKISEEEIPGIIEVVPTFCSCMVHYDPLTLSFDQVCSLMRSKLDGIIESESTVKRIVHIPVCYDQEFGPDIDFVANHANLSKKEVIEIHTSSDYLIDMLGFLPGFAYLGGLDARLHTPRLKVPRTSIEAGSVGIGGSQTGIYPLTSPGGWRLIGRSPIKPYDPERDPAILYKAGDYMHFDAITRQQFFAIQTQVAAGTYEYKIVVEGQ